MSLPADCSACVFHVASECRRHAPGPSIEPFEQALWPLTLNTQRCGEGSTDSKPVHCERCIHWVRSEGKPSPPTSTSEHYWDQLGVGAHREDRSHTGLCTRFAPGPGVTHMPVEWRATYRFDRCGDGMCIDEE